MNQQPNPNLEPAKKSLKEWIQVDNSIKELALKLKAINKQAKGLRDKKKELITYQRQIQQPIVIYLESLEDKEIELQNDNSIIKSKVKQPVASLSQAHIKNRIETYFQQIEANVDTDDLFEFIVDKDARKKEAFFDLSRKLYG